MGLELYPIILIAIKIRLCIFTNQSISSFLNVSMLFSSAEQGFIKKQDFLNANFDFGTSLSPTSLTQFVVLDFDMKHGNCESFIGKLELVIEQRKSNISCLNYRANHFFLITFLSLSESNLYFEMFSGSLGILSHCVTNERSYHSFLFNLRSGPILAVLIHSL